MIYVGKAKNLALAGRQLLPQGGGRGPPHGRPGPRDRRHRFIEAESEVDALLIEARLIKDMQPKFNQRPEGRQDVSLPGDLHPRGLSPRRIHARAAGAGHEALRPVRQRRQPARRDAGAAKDLQIPHLHAGHRRARREMALVPAVPVGQRSSQCYGAVQLADLEGRISPRHRPAADVPGREQAKTALDEMQAEMRAAAAELQFEKAARLRDEIHMLETLDDRGELDTHVQPEVFYIDPKKGLAGLEEGAQARRSRRARSKGSISRTWAAAKPWPAWCNSSTGCRSSRATSGSRSAASKGVDDFASIREVDRPALPTAARRGRDVSPTCC